MKTLNPSRVPQNFSDKKGSMELKRLRNTITYELVKVLSMVIYRQSSTNYISVVANIALPTNLMERGMYKTKIHLL